MKVYLVQHGESLEKEIDSTRPLSAKGQKDIHALAEFLSQHKIQVSRIYHSGILRAQQTAEILASRILNKDLNSKDSRSSNAVSILKGLEPTDPVAPIAYEIESWDEDTLLAGHMPFMSKLVSKLTIKDDLNPVVNYEPGSIVCLEKIEQTKWLIRWMIRPDQY